MINLEGHPLLSPEASRLSPEALAEQVEVARVVLGLTTYSPSGADAENAYKRALARQVNVLVERGVEASVLESLSRGRDSRTFREQYTDPIALRIAMDLLGDPTDGWDTLRSLRGC